MWKIIEDVIGMFVYSAAYMVIVLVSLKIVGASVSPHFEKKIAEEGDIGLSIIFASIFIGIAILLSSVVR